MDCLTSLGQTSLNVTTGGVVSIRDEVSPPIETTSLYGTHDSKEGSCATIGRSTECALTPEGRRRTVSCVLEKAWTIEATAERFQVDATTVPDGRTDS